MSVPADELLVRARNLEVGYAGEAVCAPVSLDVSPGEIVAVVGANGTGKSTLLRTIVGQQDALAGSVSVLGREPDPRTVDLRAATAIVLGDDDFFPALTVTEHLLLVALGHGVAGARDVVTGLVEEFGLADRADALPSALSSGQRRRVLLAAAFARPRSLLVLDEPEQRLDSGMRHRLTDRLVEESEAGGGVLLATHDPVVATVATRVVVLDDDGVRTVGPDDGAAAIEAL